MADRPGMSRTILHVSGFSNNMRAKDLAYEFERYGRLIRCDIPALKTPASAPPTHNIGCTRKEKSSSENVVSSYAFVEFRDEACAEDAYYDMHGRSIDRRRIGVQWAKAPAAPAWRSDSGFGGPPRGRPRPRSRSPPPARREPPRDAPRARERERSRSPVARASARERSRSPRREDRGGSARSRGHEDEARDREEDEVRKRREGSEDDQ